MTQLILFDFVTPSGIEKTLKTAYEKESEDLKLFLSRRSKFNKFIPIEFASNLEYITKFSEEFSNNASYFHSFRHFESYNDYIANTMRHIAMNTQDIDAIKNLLRLEIDSYKAIPTEHKTRSFEKSIIQEFPEAVRFVSHNDIDFDNSTLLKLLCCGYRYNQSFIKELSKTESGQREIIKSDCSYLPELSRFDLFNDQDFMFDMIMKNASGLDGINKVTRGMTGAQNNTFVPNRAHEKTPDLSRISLGSMTSGNGRMAINTYYIIEGLSLVLGSPGLSNTSNRQEVQDDKRHRHGRDLSQLIPLFGNGDKILEISKSRPDVFCYVSDRLCLDREFIKRALKVNPKVYNFLGTAMQNDFEICLEMIKIHDGDCSQVHSLSDELAAHLIGSMPLKNYLPQVRLCNALEWAKIDPSVILRFMHRNDNTDMINYANKMGYDIINNATQFIHDLVAEGRKPSVVPTRALSDPLVLDYAINNSMIKQGQLDNNPDEQAILLKMLKNDPEDVLFLDVEKYPTEFIMELCRLSEDFTNVHIHRIRDRGIVKELISLGYEDAVFELSDYEMVSHAIRHGKLSWFNILKTPESDRDKLLKEFGVFYEFTEKGLQDRMFHAYPFLRIPHKVLNKMN